MKEVKGAGGIEKTDCERPAAVEHIMQSIQTIAQVVGDQMGQTVNIKRKDMKQCLAQVRGPPGPNATASTLDTLRASEMG